MSTPLESRPRTILVVDDNQDAVMLLSRVLERWGNTVRTAHDGPRALELAAGERFDLILLDIGLPGMDGYQVAEALRTSTPPYEGPLVALTGYGKDEDRARADEVGFTHHLLKPLDLEVLQQLLAELP